MKEVENNKYIYNIEEKIGKNYERAPPKFFNKSNAILLDTNLIEETILLVIFLKLIIGLIIFPTKEKNLIQCLITKI